MFIHTYHLWRSTSWRFLIQRSLTCSPPAPIWIKSLIRGQNATLEHVKHTFLANGHHNCALVADFHDLVSKARRLARPDSWAQNESIGGRDVGCYWLYKWREREVYKVSILYIYTIRSFEVSYKRIVRGFRVFILRDCPSYTCKQTNKWDDGRKGWFCVN